MVMTQRTVRRFLQLFTFQEFNAPYTSGRTQMIHDGIGFVESLRRNDVFVGDAFVLVGRRGAVAMKPDMMFPRNLTKSLIKRHVDFTSLQIASPLLLFLERFEQRFEIAFAETLRPFALDDFEEERRAIFHRFGEYLQQISLVVAIDQNPESL